MPAGDDRRIWLVKLSRPKHTASPKIGRTTHDPRRRLSYRGQHDNPRCPEGRTMPSISRDTATQRVTDGPVESFSADLEGGYTVNFGRFPARHGPYASSEGSARRQLPVPPLGLRAPRPAHLPLR